MSELDLHALAAAQSPILFLDVDGVLNTSQMPGKHALHPKLLRRLKAVVDATACDIVLSTTWRLQRENEGVLLAALEAAGIPRETVAGHTPSLGVQDLRWHTGGAKRLGEARRAAEIVTYLDARPEITTFAVVDDIDVLAVDDEAMRAKLAPHFVRTMVESGLSERCCERLGAVLRGTPIPQKSC